MTMEEAGERYKIPIEILRENTQSQRAAMSNKIRKKTLDEIHFKEK